MTHQEAIAFAADILEQANADVKEALNAPEHMNLVTSIVMPLQVHINRLRAMSGTAHKNKATVTEFKPITNFMGEELSMPKQVEANDLSPKEAEKKAFLAKVNKLYMEFNTLSADAILNSYSTPQDELALRGVAKKAGLQDFGTAEINIRFIQAISKGIEEREAQAVEQKKIEEDQAKQTRIAEINERLEQIGRDREVLDAEYANAKTLLEETPKDKQLPNKIAKLGKEIAVSDILVNELQEELATLQA